MANTAPIRASHITQILDLLTGVMTDQPVTLKDTLSVWGTSASTFTAGVNSTNPQLQVDASAGSVATGLKVTGAAAGGNVSLAPISSGSNESLLLAGLGTGIVQTTAATASATVGAFKAINSNGSAVGMAAMFSNLSANNAANAAELGFSMNNSTPAEKQYAAIRVTSTTVTAGSEDGTMIFRTQNAGTMTTILTLSRTAGATVATGGFTVTTGGAVVTAGGLQVTAGNVGIGTAPGANVGIQGVSVITGSANPTGINSVFTFGSDQNLTTVEGIASQIIMSGSTAHTATSVYAIHIYNPTKNGASAITNNYGLLVDAQTAGGTNNYGIYVNAPSGGSGANIGVVSTAPANGIGGWFGNNSGAPITNTQSSAIPTALALVAASANNGTIGGLAHYDTGGGANAKWWVWITQSNSLSLETANDNGTYGASFMTFTRSGSSTTEHDLNASAVKFPNVSTTASAANAFLDNAASNNLLRSTSSLRYKNVTGNLVENDATRLIMGLQPITYTSKAVADDPQRVFVGLGAEDVAALDDRFVTFDKDGRPDWVQYPTLVVPLISVVQDHEQRLAALEGGGPTPAPVLGVAA